MASSTCISTIDMNFPAPNPNPDLSEVIEQAEDWLRNRVAGGMSSTTEVMIFGPLMQAIYGKDIFDWLRKNALNSPAK